MSAGGDLWAALDQLAALGVRRFVFTDIARDGMLGGPNLERLALVAERTSAHVTASGGVSSLEDLDRVAEEQQAAADTAKETN